VTELAVIGAGPAGLAAALAAAQRGVDVTLIDGAATLGGQIWRQPSSGEPADDAVPLLRAVPAHPRVDVLSATSVVHAAATGPGARVLLRAESGIWALDAAAVVLATGAAELSLPFPGWDLPGVVTPGAAQAMLKAHGVPIGRRVVVAGTGAFLWPVAAGLITAGVQVAAIVEAAPLVRGARLSAGLLRHRAIAGQAAGYLRTVVRARVPLLAGRAVVGAHGADRVESVTVARLDGAGRRGIAADAACVGWGFVPSVELARSLGCAELIHPTHPYTTVAVDGDQATSVEGIFAAGEVTGIGGAVVAAAEGEIAGAAAATSLGRASTAGQLESLARARATLPRARRAAAVLDRAFPVPERWTEWLDAESVVCRCEEVTWGEIAGVVDSGFVSARGVKGQTRCGMGWCQGRICGPALQSAISRRARRPLAEVGDLAGRPFAAPLTVGELTELADPADPARSQRG
jgi:NADPH-dependent 2,4-dienoyl-CoA reductase/sulfur reductase-like enzyme